MKKTLLLSVLILSFISISTYGQNSSVSPTTEEEYVMGSVGYKMFMQMRVELKPGYKVNDLQDIEYGDRKASFKALHRSGEKQPCAIIMVYTKLRGAPEYYCIPTLDAPEGLWDRFRMSLAGETDIKQEQLQFLGFAIAKAMMFYAGK